MKRLVLILAAALAAAGLAGCATGYLLDNQVQSYSHLSTIPAPATYRFERLPSQQAMNPQQTELEALADGALHKAGFRRDDASPRYSVLVTARAQRTLSPYSDPWDYGWGWGGVGGVGGGPAGATIAAWGSDSAARSSRARTRPGTTAR